MALRAPSQLNCSIQNILKYHHVYPGIHPCGIIHRVLVHKIYANLVYTLRDGFIPAYNLQSSEGPTCQLVPTQLDAPFPLNVFTRYRLWPHLNGTPE